MGMAMSISKDYISLMLLYADLFSCTNEVFGFFLKVDSWVRDGIGGFEP